MDPKTAITIIDSIKASEPEKLVAAGNSVALETPKWVLQASAASVSRDKKILGEVAEVKKIVLALVAAVQKLGGGVVASAAPDVAPAEDGAEVPPPPPSHGGQRMNGDGTPMSPEDQAREDAMDAAAGPRPVEPDEMNGASANGI